MILSLIALISLIAMGILAATQSRWRSDLLEIFGVIFAIAGFCGLTAYSFLVVFWVSAHHKAEIINKEFNTNYTQAQVFYASDVIDTIQQIKRQRIEINGDLLKENE